jgi:hypothetical protein
MRELEMVFPEPTPFHFAPAGLSPADIRQALAAGEVRRKRTKMTSLDFRPVEPGPQGAAMARRANGEARLARG